MQTSWRDCLPACSSRATRPAFLQNSGPPAQGWHYLQQAPPTGPPCQSQIKKRGYSWILWIHFLNRGSLLSDDFSLYQVDIKLFSMVFLLYFLSILCFFTVDAMCSGASSLLDQNKHILSYVVSREGKIVRKLIHCLCGLWGPGKKLVLFYFYFYFSVIVWMWFSSSFTLQ